MRDLKDSGYNVVFLKKNSQFYMELKICWKIGLINKNENWIEEMLSKYSNKFKLTGKYSKLKILYTGNINLNAEIEKVLFWKEVLNILNMYIGHDIIFKPCST